MKFSLQLSCWLMLVIFMLFPTTSEASPINIEASEIGRWDLEDQIFVMEGDVRLKVDELEITGDKLIYRVEDELILVEGNVFLKQNEEETRGSLLEYNLQTNKGTFLDARSTITADKIEGPIFLFGDKVDIDGENYNIQHGKVTTCDISRPHYHVAAREIEIYPADKVIIKGVTYYEGRIPLFYWPYLAVPLHEGVQQNNLALPRIGYGAEEGWYIKNSYNYYINRNAYGAVFYDYYTQLGSGYGVRHNYQLTEDNKGSIYVYGIPNEYKQLLRTQLEHELQLDNLDFSFDNFYEREMQDGQLQVDWEVASEAEYRTDSITVSGKGSYQHIEGSSEDERWSLTGRYQQKLTDNWSLNFQGAITYREKAYHQRTVDRLAETSYRFGPHTLNLAFQQKYNPELLEDDEVQPNWSSVDRLPEIKWQWRNPKVGNTSLRGNFFLEAGQFQEYPSQVSGNRGAAKLELSSHTWRPVQNTTLTYRGYLHGYLYDELAQSALQSRLNLHQRFTSSLTGYVSYLRQDAWGETPFRFDKQRERNILTYRFNYSTKPLSFSIRSGYDYIRGRHQNLIAQVGMKNDKGWNFDLYANYNLNMNELGNVAPVIEYSPNEETQISIGGRYSFPQGQWQRIDGQFSFDFTDTWRVSYKATYSPSREQFTSGQLSLTKDLHCRELTFRYDQMNEEFWVEYRLYAFPELPLRLGSGGLTDSLFDLQNVQDILGIEDEAR